jgi:hypothetical protein
LSTTRGIQRFDVNLDRYSPLAIPVKDAVQPTANTGSGETDQDESPESNSTGSGCGASGSTSATESEQDCVAESADVAPAPEMPVEDDSIP